MTPKLRNALRMHLALLTNNFAGGGGIMATRIWYLTGERMSSERAWEWLEESFRNTYPDTYAAMQPKKKGAGGGRLTPKVRYQALKNGAGRCDLCGRGASQGAVLEVDHIKPVSTHPHLANEVENLQILCENCNIGKGARDDTDWRATSDRASPARPESGHIAPVRLGAACPTPA